MKVIFPGPAVVGEARLRSTCHMDSGIQLEVGENELPKEWADRMLESGLVGPADDPAPAAVVAEEDEDSSVIGSRRKR